MSILDKEHVSIHMRNAIESAWDEHQKQYRIKTLVGKEKDRIRSAFVSGILCGFKMSEAASARLADAVWFVRDKMERDA